LFFFQAEDGIRYRNVTGVQTCALPIMKKLTLLLLSLMTVFALAACGDNNNDNEAENNNGEEMDLPEPDLDDVPDVVAEVNGEEVSKDEFAEVYEQQFQQQAMQAQMSGEGGDI